MSFVAALLDAIAPPLCVLCRGPPGALPWLCAKCERRLELRTGPCCLRCGAPRPLPAPVCAHCPDWPRRLLAARNGAPHTGAARDLVHALKFGGNLAAARPLAALAGAAAREMPLGADPVVVPVPLHWRKRRRRGFNQATEIARYLARERGFAFRPGLLRRVRAGESSRTRTRNGRRRETRGAFRARAGAEGQEILLVDDVVTTGATVGACARALSRKGATAIYAATATRAPGCRTW